MERNLKKAQELFLLAAVQGHEAALENLRAAFEAEEDGDDLVGRILRGKKRKL